MKRATGPSHTASRPDHLVCPACGYGELHPRGLLSHFVGCDSCGRAFNGAIVTTLEQIVAFPDVLGSHACEECEHPDMHCLPDKTFHCPVCGSEVLPKTNSKGVRWR